MTFYSGQNGRMKIQNSAGGYDKLAKVQNWSINTTMSPLATTTLEDTDQTFISGLRTSTGSCRLFYYDSGGSSSTNDCSTLIKKLMKEHKQNEGEGVADPPENVVFQLQVLGSTTKTIEVEALLTSVSMTMAVGEVLSADVSFQVNGALDKIENL